MNVKEGHFRPVSAKLTVAGDPRKIALDCMLSALMHLDSDADISPVIGSQLQLAIDRLVMSLPGDVGADQHS